MLHVKYDELKNRTEKAKEYMKKRNIDAILITGESNFLYFTGLYTKFWYSPTRPYYLIIPRKENLKPIAIVPSIIAKCFESKSWLGKGNVKTWVHPSNEGLGENLVVDTLNELADNGTIGFTMGEGSHLRVPLLAIDNIRKKIHQINWKIVDITYIIESLRSIKSPFEIYCIQKSCEAASVAFKELSSKMKKLYQTQNYITERDVQRLIRISILEAGADSAPYVMVQSGQDGYDNILMEPTNRILQNGDLLIIDIGCVYKGYWSDFNRNFSIGLPTENIQKYHRLLWKATEKGFEYLRQNNRTASGLYKTMSNVLSDEHHIGRFGHGIGLQLTEHFSVLPTDNTKLLPGMVLTLEPGVYIKDDEKMMVHEENIVITKDGPKWLSERVSDEIEYIILESSSKL